MEQQNSKSTKPADESPGNSFSRHHWNALEDGNVGIKVMELGTLGDNPSPDSLVNYTNFLRSDHARFWFSNHQEYYGSFKSVMVSDTGPARGIMQRWGL